MENKNNVIKNSSKLKLTIILSYEIENKMKEI